MEPSEFEFGSSDDVLCSSVPSTAADHSTTVKQELHKSTMERSSGYPASTDSPPVESSFNQDVISTVEQSMEKYTGNLMRFLEGVSSRFSHLEVYCYNLDKSIEEMRSDLVRDYGESETRLKSVEKHIHEVRRSVQILSDKQELVDTQKELAKLELTEKEFVSTQSSQKYDEKISPPLSEPKISDTPSEQHGQQQLALALPNQVAPPQSSYNVPPQTHPYYMPPPQTANPLPPSHSYQPTQRQVQDPSGPFPHQTQPQVNPNTHAQSLTPYQQQQWAQLQQPVMQPQIRPSTQPVNSYPPSQPMQRLFPSTQSCGTPPQHLKMGYGDDYKPVGHHHLQQSAYPPSPNNMVVPPQSVPHGYPYNELVEKLVGMGYRGDHVTSVMVGLEKRGEPTDFNAMLNKLNGQGWSG